MSWKTRRTAPIVARD